MSTSQNDVYAWGVEYTATKEGNGYAYNHSALVLAVSLEDAVAFVRTIDGLKDIHSIVRRHGVRHELHASPAALAQIVTNATRETP